MNKATVLLVDDDKDYRDSLRQFLELEDYAVQEASSLEEAEEKLAAGNVDVALVDLRLTDNVNDRDFSGLRVAKWAADKEASCIIITSYPTVEVTRFALRSRGAEPRAEDLVPKKDGPQAILDAIEVVLGRKSEQLPEAPLDLEIDLARGLVYRKGELVGLSQQQYKLLAYLCGKRGVVCSSEELLKAVYDADVLPGEASADTRLERLMDRVREKIEPDPSNPRYLLRAPGRGFWLEL